MHLVGQHWTNNYKVSRYFDTDQCSEPLCIMRQQSAVFHFKYHSQITSQISPDFFHKHELSCNLRQNKFVFINNFPVKISSGNNNWTS